MSTLVGVVAEGTNDFPALEAFLNAELPSSIQRPLSFIALQPTVDATSGKAGGGGWGRVVGWCTTYSGEAMRTFFSPLFAGDPACDVIVLQIDGDAVQHCALHSTVPAPKDTSDIPESVAALEGMVATWLDTPTDLSSRFAFAFPFLHTEAWMMAGLMPDHVVWERVDAKAELRKLKKGTGIRKMAAFYRSMAETAAANSAEIARQCASYQAFQASAQSVSI